MSIWCKLSLNYDILVLLDFIQVVYILRKVSNETNYIDLIGISFLLDPFFSGKALAKFSTCVIEFSFPSSFHLRSSLIIGVPFPSRPANHQSERGKKQKRWEKALHIDHDHRQREDSRRQTTVNQFNFTIEYKEYIGLRSIQTNLNLF